MIYPEQGSSPGASVLLKSPAPLVDKNIQQALERRQGVVCPSVTHGRPAFIRIGLKIVSDKNKHRKQD